MHKLSTHKVSLAYLFKVKSEITSHSLFVAATPLQEAMRPPGLLIALTSTS